MRKLLLLAAAVSLTASAQGAEKEKEAAAELELGTATEWALPGGGFSSGPSVGIEFTPIKDWLEIEAGVSPVFGGGRTEWSTELVFKKPFSLSDKVEMMVGLGPEWLYKTGHGETTNSIGGVALVDFQIWPFPRTKVRLVRRAELRLRFRSRARKIAWRDRRCAHSDPVNFKLRHYRAKVPQRLLGSFEVGRGRAEILGFSRQKDPFF